MTKETWRKDRVRTADADRDTTLWPSHAQPRNVARYLFLEVWPYGTLRRHRYVFYEWDAGYWREYKDADLKSFVTNLLDKKKCDGGQDRKGNKKDPVPWAPSPRRVSDVIDMLGDAVHIPDDVDAPAWLEPVEDEMMLNPKDEPAERPDPRELLVTANGILHLPTRRLLPHTQRLFTFRSVPFEYDPEATADCWIAFLRSLELTRDEAFMLEQFVGYVLSGDTTQQKILLVVGPRRSGKGTIAATVTALLGERHVTSPTLSAFGTNFGLQDAIGKSLIVVPDARLGGRHDLANLTERLLSISGEDHVTIDRKHKTPWTGRLGARIVILTNELPRITDAAAALASRLLVLRLRNSFLGREDRDLRARLIGALPGILNRALDGYDLLRERGRFIEPESSVEVVQQVEELASPVKAFVDACCAIDAANGEEKDALYAEFTVWASGEGWRHVPTKAVFFRDLRAAYPQLSHFRPRLEDGRRPHTIRGLTLTTRPTAMLPHG